MDKLISVVIPAYNVEKWIEECLQSICQQTYKNLEIIVVDDGSTDNTKAIVERMMVQDGRIVLYSQSNAGVSAARNKGISLANGNYITFVDSDDAIHPQMLQILANILDENDLDIVDCNATRTGKFNILEDDTLVFFTHQEAMKKCLVDDYGLTVWGRLYRRHVIKDIKFPEGRKFEDSAVGHLYLMNSNKVGSISSALYFYRKNMDSICQTSFKDKDRYDYFLGEKERYDFAKQFYPQYEAILMAKMIKAALSCLTAVFAVDRDYKNNQYYNVLYPFLKECRQNKCDVSVLSSKYRFLFYCVGVTTFLHRIYAKGSLLFKHRQ